MKQLLLIFTFMILMCQSMFSANKIKEEDVIGQDANTVMVKIVDTYDYCNYNRYQINEECFLLRMQDHDKSVFVIYRGICVEMVGLGEQKSFGGQYGLYEINNGASITYSYAKDPVNDCGGILK